MCVIYVCEPGSVQQLASCWTLTSVLNTTSGEAAHRAADAVQPLSSFIYPNAHTCRLKFELFFSKEKIYISSASPLSLFSLPLFLSLIYGCGRTTPRRRLLVPVSVVMALGAAAVRQAADELLVDEGAHLH